MTITSDIDHVISELRQQVCDLHALLTQYELVIWTAGNVSARVPGHALMVIKPSGVVALRRKRASLLPLQDELRALHIPAQIGEKTELIDCCEVLDIVALLDVLVSPQHDLSLARALR